MNPYAIFGAIAFIVAALGGGAWYLGHERSVAFTQGEESERAKWQQREIEQNAIYEAEIEDLRRGKDAQSEQFNRDLAAATGKYERARNDKVKADQYIADIRAGRIVLHDSGRAPGGCAPGGGQGRTDTAAPGAGDAGKGGFLSIEGQVSLLQLGSEADEVVQQLTLAQSVITAYYNLCKDR